MKIQPEQVRNHSFSPHLTRQMSHPSQKFKGRRTICTDENNQPNCQVSIKKSKTIARPKQKRSAIFRNKIRQNKQLEPQITESLSEESSPLTKQALMKIDSSSDTQQITCQCGMILKPQQIPSHQESVFHQQLLDMIKNGQVWLCSECCLFYQPGSYKHHIGSRQHRINMIRLLAHNEQPQQRKAFQQLPIE